MRDQEKITFDQIKKFESQFNQGIEDFDIKAYQDLKKVVSQIQDEMELMLLVSEERYEERMPRHESLNQKIKEQNNQSRKEIIPNYITQNPSEFIKKLEKVGIKIDEKGGLHIGKLKKGAYVQHFIDTAFDPKPQTKDYYPWIKELLKQKAQNFMVHLKDTLEDARSRAENFFQSYDNLVQLFQKLEINPQMRSYDLFSKGTGIPRAKSPQQKFEEIEKEAPDFKKIGYIFKYLKDHNIALQPRHILSYPDGSLCIYLQSKNITILVSDEIGSNRCFRDATYIIKGPVLEDKPITKEMIGEYEGKRVMFSDNRENRIEDILDQSPDSWEQIKSQNEIHDDEEMKTTKELITDKQEFIRIIKSNFTMDEFDSVTYLKFMNGYNANLENTFIMRSNLNSNYALLGLPRNSGVNAIRKAIRGIAFRLEKDNKANYIGNSTVREQLEKLRNYSDFNPQKDLGNTSYGFRSLNLLKIAMDNQDSRFIKNLTMQERKEKLTAITGIDLPLTGQTLSIWLGGMSCSTKKYQTLLRKRFCLTMDGKENTKDYVNICSDIQKSEEEFIGSSGLHSKSIKKTEDFVQATKDEISSSLETPKSGGPYKKIEISKPKLVVEDIQKFKVYTGKIISMHAEKMHIKIHNSDIIGRSLNTTGWSHHIGEEVSVIVTDIKPSLKGNGGSYPLLTVKRYEGQEKIVEFYDKKTFDTSNLVYLSEYAGIVNNITAGKIRVSLSKDCRGFIMDNNPATKNLKRGQIHTVKFIKMIGDRPMFILADNS